MTRPPTPDETNRLDGRGAVVTGAGGGINGGATPNPEIP